LDLSHYGSVFRSPPRLAEVFVSLTLMKFPLPPSLTEVLLPLGLYNVFASINRGAFFPFFPPPSTSLHGLKPMTRPSLSPLMERRTTNPPLLLKRLHFIRFCPNLPCFSPQEDPLQSVAHLLACASIFFFRFNPNIRILFTPARRCIQCSWDAVRFFFLLTRFCFTLSGMSLQPHPPPRRQLRSSPRFSTKTLIFISPHVLPVCSATQ